MYLHKVETNQLGCYAEYLFCAECTKRGLIVSMPLLDSCIYDCLVDTGFDIIKVQIKASEKKPTDGRNSVNIPLNNAKSKYTTDKVHYFAIYVAYYDGFFIFPNLGNMQSFRASKKGKNKIYYNRFSFV